MSVDWVSASWSIPPNIKAFTTSRNGGKSLGNYRSLNLSYDVGDNSSHIDKNREELSLYIGRRVPFLKCEHQTNVIDVDKDFPDNLYADAAIIRHPFQTVGILTADCLPVFIANKKGTVSAIAHCGWRGLSQGLIEKVIGDIGESPANLCAFIGPGISAYGYLVGSNVFYSFKNYNSDLIQFFKKSTNPDISGKAHCDLKGIAKFLLNRVGVNEVNIHDCDTYRDKETFFSYRRDYSTGRMASVILMLPVNFGAVEEKIVEKDVFGEIKQSDDVDIPLDF